ncbi:MAG TPA: addiction module antidote protein [Roseiarcus sp.]|nr:addiction module antidote protein [Roseiarcus sp.]
MPLETTRWDPVDDLKSPEDERLYLEAAFEDGDPAIIAAALGDVARARGMAKIAEEAGLTRDALYKSLKSGGNPTLATLIRVADALGYRLAIQAKAA